MAPIKFEDQVREKLQERELSPKKESWELLAQKLDAQGPVNKQRSYLWIAVAASFVGMLLLGTWLLNNEDVSQELVEETPVETLQEDNSLEPKTEIASDDTKDIEITTPDNEEEAEQTIQAEPVLAESKQENIIKQSVPSEALNEIPVKEDLAVNNTTIETIQPTIKEKNENTFIDQKVDEVVVAVQQIQKQNNIVTIEEIDALLAKAQRDIANQKLLQSTTAKVDATSLLLEVESELERSFRDKVFDALGEGFRKVRTAVAERNY